MSDLLQSLQNPDVSSSLFPLLVVTSILVLAFFVAFCFSVIKVWRFFNEARAGMPTTAPPAEKPAEEIPIYLNRHGKFRSLLRHVFILADEPRGSISVAELEALRQQVERLQREAIVARDIHAKALGRIAELEGELAARILERDDAHKLVELETLHREKVEKKGERLETQLQEIIVEVEKIYQQNAQLADIQQISGKLGSILKERSNEPAAAQPTPDPRIAEQAAEIQQLKSLLTVCRERITELASSPPTPPPEKDKTGT